MNIIMQSEKLQQHFTTKKRKLMISVMQVNSQTLYEQLKSDVSSSHLKMGIDGNAITSGIKTRDALSLKAPFGR